MRAAAALALSALLAACASTPRGLPPISVVATGQTDPVGTTAADAADDPAIWRNPTDPAASLIVATDKKAGLYVYGLDGKVRSFRNAGAVNNVDLRDSVAINGQRSILVVASDRNDLLRARLALFRLDPSSATLTPLGTVEAGSGEAYGVCFYRDAGDLYAFAVLKDGTVNQVLIDLAGSSPSARTVRTMKLATQSEGCVADERTGRLYVAEELAGLWRFDAKPAGNTTPVKIAAADGQRIVADAEGVALAPVGERDGFLVVSSQGDNAYAVYRLADESYVGRFRIAAGRFGSAEETDGIELMLGDFGPMYPSGLFVAQDGMNAPAAQNFKLVSWAAIAASLGLKP
jgi:3-phytase